MRLPAPVPPPYDPLEWVRQPWSTRIRQVCQAWTAQGYGAPRSIYALYLVKIAAFIAAWVFFLQRTPATAGWNPGAWMTADVAFQKAILWAWTFEQLGLGCGSGPLTGRYLPPVGGPLYWLRPGTLRLPPSAVRAVPGLRGTRRTLVDCGLYLLLIVLLFRALLAPELTTAELLPPVLLLPLLSLRDRTQFLAARGEHYWVTAVLFATLDSWVPGAMAVQLAIWWWAATSKLTPHFPSVVSVMTSNSPLTSLRTRKAMVRSYPTDLRPSRFAQLSGLLGAAIEFTFPLMLVLGDGGPLTLAGLALMLVFHTYITSNMPMGAPLEWNFVVVYGGLFLWGAHGGVSPLDATGGLAVAFLLTWTVLIPLVGHLSPRHVSFLLAMRYYAGNWPYTVWALTPAAVDKLRARLPRSAPLVHDQVGRLFGEGVAVGTVGMVLGFRSMHLHGRVLHPLLRRFVPDLEDRVILDGELMAGMALGWNFGDGHLSGPDLLAAIQRVCGFELGEVRMVAVESQPLHRWHQDWEAWDARGGRLGGGRVHVRDYRDAMPWPEPPAAEPVAEAAGGAP